MSSVTCERRKDRVVLKTPYWRVEHDLGAGGCWRSIRFTKGSRKNLLATPVTSRIRFFRLVPGTMYNDYASFEECRERRPKVTVGETRTGDPVVVTEGRYTDASGNTIPVRYRRRSEYREWGLVASELEVLPERDVPEVVEFSAAAFTLRPGMTDLNVREHPACAGHSDLLGLGEWFEIEPGRAVYSQRYTPMHLSIFEKDVEGIDFCPSSRLVDWDTQLTSDPGQGLCVVAANAEGGTHVEIDPFCRAFRRIPITLRKKRYRFRMYWGLPFVRERERTFSKYFHSSLFSDWATDTQLERLADAGVKLLRFHCDHRDDGPFWHDGMYPPFDREGMRELRRIIDTSHRLGMKIVPYVSLKEFHPESPGYRRNRKKWTQRPTPTSDGIHTYVRTGEFGHVMCMESDWLAFRKRACDVMLDDLPWDGLYFDWCSPHACMHPDHLPGAYHTDTDGFLDFLFYARRRVGPDGILLLHLSGLPYVVAENLADLALIYEDTQGVVPLPGDFPSQCDFFPVAPRHLVMNIGNDPVNTRKFIMGGMLQGHPAITQMPARRGRSFPAAVLEEMELFGREDLSRYRFRRASERPVETDKPTVYASLHHARGRALVYLGNFSGKPARGTFTFDPSCLGRSERGKKVSVLRMLAPGKTRAVGTRTAASLKREGVGYSMRPWGSALYRIEV